MMISSRVQSKLAPSRFYTSCFLRRQDRQRAHGRGISNLIPPLGQILGCSLHPLVTSLHESLAMGTVVACSMKWIFLHPYHVSISKIFESCLLLLGCQPAGTKKQILLNTEYADKSSGFKPSQFNYHEDETWIYKPNMLVLSLI